MAENKGRDKTIRLYLSLLITILIFAAIIRYATVYLNKLNVEYYPPNLSLAKVFTTNMLLQRDQDIVISGKARSGKEVEINFKNHNYKTTSDKNNNWKIHLDKQAAGGPYEIQVKSDQEKIVLENILFGDQCLILGESIINFPLSKTNNFEQELTAVAKLSNVRYFNAELLPERIKFTELNRDAIWQVAKPENISHIPAIPYYFAKRLSQSSNVPIGIIKVAGDYIPLEALLKSSNSTKTLIEHRYEAPFNTNLNLNSNQTLQLSIDKITEGDLTLFINEERIGQIKKTSGIRIFTIPSSLLKNKYNKIELSITNVEDPVQLSRDQLNLAIHLSSGAQSERIIRPGYKWHYRKQVDIATPGLVFKEMLKPLLEMKFSRILIYQGDSNLDDPSHYQDLLIAWLNEIQANFKNTKIIFLGLRNINTYNPNQINANQIRSIQRRVASNYPKIQFVETSDLEFKTSAQQLAARCPVKQQELEY